MHFVYGASWIDVPSGVQTSGFTPSNIPNLGPERNVKTKVHFSVCPGMLHSMASILHFIAFIEDVDIIQIILTHLGLWAIRNHDPPRETAIETTKLICDDQYAQVPFDDHWVQ